MAYNLNLNSPDLWQTNSDAAITATSTKIDSGTIVAGPTDGSKLKSKKPVLVSTKPKVNKFQDVVPSTIVEDFGTFAGTFDLGRFLTLTPYMDSALDDTTHTINTTYSIVPPNGCKSGKLFFMYSLLDGTIDAITLTVTKAAGGTTVFNIASGSTATEALDNVVNEIELSDIYIKNPITILVNTVNNTPTQFTMGFRLYFAPYMEVESKDIVYGVDTELGSDEPDESKSVGNIRTRNVGARMRAGSYNFNTGTFDSAPTSTNTTTNLTDKENTTNSNGRGLGGRLTYAMQAAPKNESHDAPKL